MYHKCYEQQISAGKEKWKDMFENQPDLLNVKQCQQELQIGRCSVLELIHTGRIKAFKLKGSWKIPKKELESYIRRMV